MNTPRCGSVPSENAASDLWTIDNRPENWINLTFAVVWAGFGVMHLLKLRELVSAQSPSGSPELLLKDHFAESPKLPK